MVAGLLLKNKLGSAVLLEKMLGSCVELENMSGTAVGSGPGPRDCVWILLYLRLVALLSMVLDLNRSSNSLRAEYRSEADMVCCSLGAGGVELTRPLLGFLFIGGRVVVGGLARGSEMLGLVTQGVTHLTGLELRFKFSVSSSVKRRVPSSLLVSEGSSGGREEIGARKGFKGIFGLGGVDGGRNGFWGFEGGEGDLSGLARKGLDAECMVMDESVGRLW